MIDLMKLLIYVSILWGIFRNLARLAYLDGLEINGPLFRFSDDAVLHSQETSIGPFLTLNLCGSVGYRAVDLGSPKAPALARWPLGGHPLWPLQGR